MTAAACQRGPVYLLAAFIIAEILLMFFYTGQNHDTQVHIRPVSGFEPSRQREGLQRTPIDRHPGFPPGTSFDYVLSHPLVAKAFADLNPPRPPHCPDRYLATSKYGNFNNNMLVLVRQVLLGALLNRTVITFDEIVFKWMNTSNLCVTTERKHKVIQEMPQTVGYIPVISHDTESSEPGEDTFGVPLLSIALKPRDYIRAGLKWPRLGAVASAVTKLVDPEYPLIYFRQLFFTIIPHSLFLSVMREMPYTHAPTDVAHKFIRNTFGDKPFLALHFRNFDGFCDFAVNIGLTDEVKLFHTEYCSFEPQFVEKWLHAKDPTLQLKDLQIFFAGDYQRPDVEKVWRTMPNVHSYTPLPEEFEIASLVDNYILSQSTWLLVHPFSTFGSGAAARSFVRDDGKKPAIWLAPIMNGTEFYEIYVERDNA